MMQRLFLWVAALVFLAAPAAADVGSDFDYKYIYYLDRDVLIRGYCPDTVIVISRANCIQSESVLAWAFFDRNERQYQRGISEAENKVNQVIVLMTDLDTKILMMLQDAPDYDQTRLPAIRQKERALSDLEIRIAGSRDQIHRLEGELAAGEDPDVRALLHAEQGRLERMLISRANLRSELNTLRKQHLDANNGIVSVDTYRRLVAQRERAEIDLAFAEQTLAFEVSRFGGYLGAVKFLKDSTVWSFTSQNPWDDMTSRAVNDFVLVFNDLHSSHIFNDWSGRQLSFLVALPGARMWDFQYTNLNSGGSCTGLRIEHKLFTLTHQDNHLYVDRDRISGYPHLAPLFGNVISGYLRVTPLCSGTWRQEDVTGKIVVTDE
jgi:hypothetical protein